MSSSSVASTVSTTPDSSVLVVTITVAALTTTFTPPPECTQNHLSQISSPGYEIWLNEPQPVPGTKVGDCYPSQFIQGYTSIANSSSSIAPMFNPLVCPLGWHTVATYTNGYIACCASGYQLVLPKKTVDTNRPAYGGTCYSDFTVSSTVTVTAYDSANVTATAEWVASTSGAQAYAHPMDGFKAEVITTSAGSNTTSTVPSSNVSSTDASTTGLSGGAIAGIVIGSVVGLAAILIAVFFLFRKRRKNPVGRRTDNDNGNPKPETGGNADGAGVGDDAAYIPKELPNFPGSDETWTTSPTVGSTGSPGVGHHERAEMPVGTSRYELDGAGHAVEMDTGYHGVEMRGT